jgi:hypothetical protein
LAEQGTKAFCSGGDQALRDSDGYVDFDSFGRLNVLDLQVSVTLTALTNLCTNMLNYFWGTNFPVRGQPLCSFYKTIMLKWHAPSINGLFIHNADISLVCVELTYIVQLQLKVPDYMVVSLEFLISASI